MVTSPTTGWTSLQKTMEQTAVYLLVVKDRAMAVEKAQAMAAEKIQAEVKDLATETLLLTSQTIPNSTKAVLVLRLETETLAKEAQVKVALEKEVQVKAALVKEVLAKEVRLEMRQVLKSHHLQKALKTVELLTLIGRKEMLVHLAAAAKLLETTQVRESHHLQEALTTAELLTLIGRKEVLVHLAAAAKLLGMPQVQEALVTAVITLIGPRVILVHQAAAAKLLEMAQFRDLQKAGNRLVHLPVENSRLHHHLVAAMVQSIHQVMYFIPNVVLGIVGTKDTLK